MSLLLRKKPISLKTFLHNPSAAAHRKTVSCFDDQLAVYTNKVSQVCQDCSDTGKHGDIVTSIVGGEGELHWGESWPSSLYCMTHSIFNVLWIDCRGLSPPWIDICLNILLINELIPRLMLIPRLFLRLLWVKLFLNLFLNRFSFDFCMLIL